MFGVTFERHSGALYHDFFFLFISASVCILLMIVLIFLFPTVQRIHGLLSVNCLIFLFDGLVKISHGTWDGAFFGDTVS
jgi:hypothetical protein